MKHSALFNRLSKKLLSISMGSGVVFIWILAGHLLIGFCYWLPEVLTPRRIDDKRRHESPVYHGFPAKEFWKEHNKAFSWLTMPYYHWRRDAFEGKYTNVDKDGLRRTVSSKGDTLIVFNGGSAVWGTGVDDSNTLPSHFQKIIGDNFRVLNYGESSYVITQEVNFLMHRLAEGERPDVVIFYDGVNDIYAGAYSPQIPRYPTRVGRPEKTKKSRWVRIFEATNYNLLAKSFRKNFLSKGSDHWDKKVRPNIAEKVEETLDQYEANIRQIRGLGKEYGFKSFFFWQPNLFSLTKPMTHYEEKILAGKSEVWIEAQNQGYQRAKKRLSNRESEGIFFLGDLFNNTKKDVYIDQTHVGPEGNEILAREMRRLIGGKL